MVHIHTYNTLRPVLIAMYNGIVHNNDGHSVRVSITQYYSVLLSITQHHQTFKPSKKFHIRKTTQFVFLTDGLNLQRSDLP